MYQGAVAPPTDAGAQRATNRQYHPIHPGQLQGRVLACKDAIGASPHFCATADGSILDFAVRHCLLELFDALAGDMCATQPLEYQDEKAYHLFSE